jgi:hypothetical protein
MIAYHKIISSSTELRSVPGNVAGQSQLGEQLFLPWAAWVCIWTSAMIIVLSFGNVCDYVSRCVHIVTDLTLAPWNLPKSVIISMASWTTL